MFSENAPKSVKVEYAFRIYGKLQIICRVYDVLEGDLIGMNKGALLAVRRFCGVLV